MSEKKVQHWTSFAQETMKRVFQFRFSARTVTQSTSGEVGGGGGLHTKILKKVLQLFYNVIFKEMFLKTFLNNCI